MCTDIQNCSVYRWLAQRSAWKHTDSVAIITALWQQQWTWSGLRMLKCIWCTGPWMRMDELKWDNTKHSDVCIACCVKQALSVQVCMILVGIEQCELPKGRNRRQDSATFHPFQFQRVAALAPEYFSQRVQFAQWFLQQTALHPLFPAEVLYTDKALFTREECLNIHNLNVGAHVNPRGIRKLCSSIAIRC